MPEPIASTVIATAVPFRFGGHVALDFVNTVDSWVRPPTRHYIESFAKLIGWSVQVGLIEDAAAAMLLETVAPKHAKAAHLEALALRDALFRTFRAIIDEVPVAEQDFDQLNALLAEGRARQRFKPKDTSFYWEWEGPLDARSPTLLVALASADLLERGSLERVKQCPGPDGCGWLFLDESRNGSRKWCSMDYCGRFAKERRFAERHRQR